MVAAAAPLMLLMPLQLNFSVSWRLIVGADRRTLEQIVNVQPLTCRWRLVVL
jgi:hypothetical protein